ncbi:Gfo/Idh/MocA family oxidoreductase [Micrococcales bacterium 31B]|nr:Gfo/Idh/MocA family oxidoreductase [Micrococcales bacterium 31B]
MTATTSPPLIVGIIGAGNMARVHAAAWNAMGYQLVVYSDVGAEPFAETYGARIAPSLAALLDEVQLADVCTPTSTHEEYCLAALDAGLDVVCEKPLALTPDAATRIVERAATVGREVYPAHVVRFTAPYERAQRALVEGHVGTPAVARFRREGGRPERVDWFADFRQSGGVIMDLMIHDLDEAAWWLGPVRTVYAVQNPPLEDHGSHILAAPEVTAHVTLQHQSGAISLCRATWGPVGMPFMTAFSLSGDAGTLSYDTREKHTIVGGTVWHTDSGVAAGPLPYPDTVEQNPYYIELREFADAVEAGLAGQGRNRASGPRIAGADGAYAVTLADAAIRSLLSGGVIHLDGDTPAASTRGAAQ